MGIESIMWCIYLHLVDFCGVGQNAMHAKDFCGSSQFAQPLWQCFDPETTHLTPHRDLYG